MFKDELSHWITIVALVALCFVFMALSGCKKEEPLQASSRLFSGKEWPSHSTNYWRTEWQEAVEADVKVFAPHLPELKVTCPNSKVKVWVGDLFRAMMFAESSYNPKSRMTEDSGYDSIGLMQLSYHDGKNYGFQIKNLEDPRENIQAAVRIMGALTKDIGDGSCDFYRAAGRYWATLRTPICWNPPRLQAWQNTVKELGQCQ